MINNNNNERPYFEPLNFDFDFYENEIEGDETKEFNYHRDFIEAAFQGLELHALEYIVEIGDCFMTIDEAETRLRAMLERVQRVRFAKEDAAEKARLAARKAELVKAMEAAETPVEAAAEGDVYPEDEMALAFS